LKILLNKLKNKFSIRRDQSSLLRTDEKGIKEGEIKKKSISTCSRIAHTMSNGASVLFIIEGPLVARYCWHYSL